MKFPRSPHAWSVSPKEAVRIQRRLAGRVQTSSRLGRWRLVAGLDAAFLDSPPRCVAGVVVWDRVSGEAVEEHVVVRRLTFPYVPGLLSFRECPALLAALRKLRAEPDVLMCDGHGLAHPRRFGIACHLGVIVGLPTIGCAKSLLVGEHDAPGERRGSVAALRHKADLIGRVLRTREGVKPVYVSVGNLIDLKTACRVVLQSATGYRLPEPTRLADRLVAKAKRMHAPN